MPSEQYGQFVMPHGYAPHGYVMMGNFVPAPMHAASDAANGDRSTANAQQQGSGFLDASRSFYIAAAPPTHAGDAQKNSAAAKQGGNTASGPAPAAFLDPSGRNIIFAPAPMMWRSGSTPAQGGMPQPGPVFAHPGAQHGYMKGFHSAQHASHSNLTGMSTWDSAPSGTLPPLSESAPPPPESAPVATATTTSAGSSPLCVFVVHACICLFSPSSPVSPL